MEYILTTDQLTKNYKKYRAVDQVSMHVRKNDIYALIGRNGAGKTTILKMLSRIARPTDGTVNYFEDIRETGIGILIEEPGLYPNLSALQNLEIKRRALNTQDTAKMKELIDMVGLSSWTHVKVRSFSYGMRQRLGIALALVGDPSLLILDEPMNGLDPQGIADMRLLIQRLHESGKTIIISSHILEELSKTATCYGILENGHLKEEKTAEQIRSSLLSGIRITVDPLDKAKSLLDANEIYSYRTEGTDRILLMEKFNEIDEIINILVRGDVRVSEVRQVFESLEDYFLGTVGGSRS